jgi:adenosylmethionine-8-amino-7-oxononanoate aminotransferase
VACAATLANLDIIERERLVEHAAEMGVYFQERFAALRRRHAVIADVRGIGLLWAVILDGKGRSVGSRVSDWCYRQGMILRNNGEILVIAPSLIITRDEAEWVVDLMDRAVTAALEEAAP